ncbi:MAG TPA: hypothetical protein VE955_00165 [Candidatus Dormibacteraeota bacterium]|nr:hypothetical protein [Candidatus Dormibacteraeota bacterium]
MSQRELALDFDNAEIIDITGWLARVLHGVDAIKRIVASSTDLNDRLDGGLPQTVRKRSTIHNHTVIDNFHRR